MTKELPLDQRIVDEYFCLAAHRNTRKAAWLYGMVATFGLTPDQLFNEAFIWQGDSILLATKKRPIRPLHPQWVLLFQLKEKQPHNKWDCWDVMTRVLYQAMAYQQVSVNITDLILGYRMRKSYYQPLKKKQLQAASSPVAP